ncbi:MAG: hypothetical protein AAGJ40_04870 [Planctomycetota bacterium]
MTSRSRKKRRTTARTCIQATQPESWWHRAPSGFACLAVAGYSLFALADHADAQVTMAPTPVQWRSVPRARTSELLSPTNRDAASPRRPGWNLKWLPSHDAQENADRELSQQAFATSDRGVRQVQYEDGPPAELEMPDNPFRNPSPPEVVEPSAMEPTPLQMPSDSLPMELESLPTEMKSSSSPEAPTLPEPANLNEPLATSPTNDDSSMRDMLQDAKPLQDAEPLPAPDSPSDLEAFDANPFGRDRDFDDASQPNPPSFDESRPLADEPKQPTNQGIGLTCEDFRRRIALETIDQVSLDISPPFRPDIIDEAEYQELKSEFDQEIDTRTWRSIDGRPLATGRLADLAYERAVIRTDFGSVEELPLNRLSEADLAYISKNWGLPTECLLPQVDYQPRNWQPSSVVWAASNLCHKPLYFEEVNLERYGHTAGPLAQPVVSSAHFFLNIAVLPYKMGVHSPHECQYALGYYRPGNCAPWIIPPVPLSVKGAWYQAAAITGTALLVP